MKAGRGKRSKRECHEIKCREPAPRATVKGLRPVDPRLVGFEQCKEELLNDLRNAHERGSQSKPFDAEKAWRSLISLARLHVVRERVKQSALKPADRQARLRRMAEVLSRARNTISGVLQSDAANDLISTWWDAEPLPKHLRFWHDPEVMDLVDRNLFIDLHIFEKSNELLGALEAIALRAANDVPTRRGRPKGTANLPSDFIVTLAVIYRQITGLKPGAGEGPFARFVWKYLVAIGRQYKLESVIDDVKATRIWVKRSKWSSSPFDDSFDEPFDVSFGE